MIRLVLCGVLAAGAATGIGLGVASATATTTPTCAAANLKPVYGGQEGAAGTLQDTWRLRNVGAGSCQLMGYPAVHNYRADGRPLPTSVTHLGTAHNVLLAPGEHASFRLRYTDPGVLGCTPQPAAMLTIRAPGTALPLIAQRGEKACHGALRETPLIHGG